MPSIIETYNDSRCSFHGVLVIGPVWWGLTGELVVKKRLQIDTPLLPDGHFVILKFTAMAHSIALKKRN